MHQESIPIAVPAKWSRGVAVLIASGSAMFVLGLAVSAAFAPEWRVLHVFQALIYVALIALARRRSAWGFGAGLFVALFWNSLGIFATTATRDGISEVISIVHTGHVQRPDLMLNLLATLGHWLIIIGCAIGFMRLQPRRREWARLLAGGAIGLAYLLAIVFAFGPPQAIQLMRRVFGGSGIASVVRPGDPALDTAHITATVTDVRYLGRSAAGDTVEHELYRQRVEEHPVTLVDGPGVLIVKASETPQYHFVDTLVLRRSGLVPVWEHMQNQRATLTMTYEGGHVLLRRAVPDSATRSVDHDFGGPVFAFNEQELVLRSLPLSEGYTAILPLYSEGSDSLEMDSVSVTAATPAAGEGPAWRVRFADPAIVEVYVIDAASRRITHHDIDGRKSGTRVRVLATYERTTTAP